MIQGDSLVGNQNPPIADQNMDLFDRLNGGLPSIDNGLYDNSLSPHLDIGNPSDPGNLYAINSSEFLRVEDFDINAYLDEPSLFKQEVDEEEVPEQPKNDVFPDLKEHDFGNLEFNIVLNQYENQNRNNWYYSKDLQKIFISSNKKFYIEIEHKSVDYELYLRLMMVFIEEISTPVKRCQNHIHEINDIQSGSKKFSVVRTENTGAEYCGNENGKNIKDRLSVLIPLSNVSPNEKNMAKQSIALEFKCQNSCIGRKPTALIFYLENKTGAILSKKFINIRVCSGPKRDKSAEESKFLESKRPADQDSCLLYGHRPSKILKIKQETSISDNSDDNSSNQNSIKMEHSPQPVPGLRKITLPDGRVHLTLELPNDAIANEVITLTYNSISGAICRDPRRSNWNVFLDKLEKLQNE